MSAWNADELLKQWYATRPTTAPCPAWHLVSVLQEEHRETWRDKPESYWYMRLGEEFGELGASLAGDHEHSPDWELQQIAAICLNWLEMRLENNGE